MIALNSAALLLLSFGLWRFGSLWLAPMPPDSSSVVWALASLATVIVISIGLLRRSRAAWVAALIYSILFIFLGLLMLLLSQLLDLWLLPFPPRLLVIVTTLSTLVVTTAFCLLLLPGTRAALNGTYHPANAKTRLTAGLLILLCLAGISALGWWTLQRYPDRVVDNADLFSFKQEQRLARFHGLLRHDYGIDYYIITGRNLGDIDREAARLFRQQDVGSASDKGRGLLLLIDAAQNQLRMEVSYTLEPVFVDAFVAYIERRQMTEFFADGRIAAGILATSEMIVMRAQHAKTNAGFVGEAWLAGSGGAGASMSARLNTAEKETPPQQQRQMAISQPASTPMETLAAYQRAMDARNDNPHLAIYSQVTQSMLENWTVTPAQMDNVARSLRNCNTNILRTNGAGTRAVLRAPWQDRTCPPYFFVMKNGHWRLDLEPMMRVVRFGRKNAWHLNLNALDTYRFAFRDLTFDHNGYPMGLK